MNKVYLIMLCSLLIYSVHGNYSGQTLKGNNFSGQNLTGANFNSTTLLGVKFDGAILDGATFRSATITNVGDPVNNPDEQQQHGAYTTFRNAHMHNVDFGQLSGTDMAGAQTVIIGGDFTDADLTGTTFQGAALKGCSFAFATLANANMLDPIDGRTNIVLCNFICADTTGLQMSDKTKASQINLSKTGAPAPNCKNLKTMLAGC